MLSTKDIVRSMVHRRCDASSEKHINAFAEKHNLHYSSIDDLSSLVSDRQIFDMPRQRTPPPREKVPYVRKETIWPRKNKIATKKKPK